MTTATVASIASAFLSGLVLWVLSDLRDRVKALENLFFSRRGREIAEILKEGESHA
jgi:hypothetical protein